MMEKLYSVNKDQSYEEQMQESDQSGTVNAKKILIENLQKRKNFEYGATNFCKALFCCCCLCCSNKKQKKEAILYEKGVNKLHEEMDLLFILKQLRVAAFTSQAFLKPHQSLLVKWFEQYNIKTSANEVQTGKVEEIHRRKSITLNDVQNLAKDSWDEKSDSEDSEDEAEDLLEKRKHSILLDHSELDSIKEFDPINDRVDQLILKKVVGETRTDEREMLGRTFSPGPVTSLNGDAAGYERPDMYNQGNLQPRNMKQTFGSHLIDDPG